MDLGAYAQIEDLEIVLKENNISIPRLRGLRDMAVEKPVSEDEIKEIEKRSGIDACEALCRSNFDKYNYYECSWRTDLVIDKYMLKDDNGRVADVNWSAVHGKKRKAFKFAIKKAKKRVREQFEMFNRYCGREDVLYIHSRIGGNNWKYYDGNELTKEDWFLEKCDDAYDSTYCDIYAKINKSIKEVMQ